MQGNTRMEEIMAEINEHLKPVIDYGANGNTHHYNRAWEKIDAWFHRWNGKTVDMNNCKRCDRLPQCICNEVCSDCGELIGIGKHNGCMPF